MNNNYTYSPIKANYSPTNSSYSPTSIKKTNAIINNITNEISKIKIKD